MINIYEPEINKYKYSAILAIESGWISNHGEFIEKSSKKLKEILKVKNIILMANGTCATHCLFLSLKYKYPNINTIYVPNNCYVAAWNSLLMEYQKDVIEVMKMDINTWNICVNKEYIESLKPNSAVLIVHNLGNIINVPRLKLLRPDIIFIEDNCEGFTGKYENILSGTSNVSLCSSISFYGNKIITTGEGGAFLTNDDDVYNYILKVYSQGMSPIRYLHDTHAYNYRMTNIEAAFLFDQLNDYENIVNNKKKIFDNYKILLSSLIVENKISLFKNEDYTESSCWIFSIRIINNTKSIIETYTFFNKFNIDIRPFFYPINSHKHLKDIPFDDSIPDILNNEIIMIPSSPSISVESQNYVVKIIDLFVSNIDITAINNKNIDLLTRFIDNKIPDTFRYFNNRSINIINNHIITLLVVKDNVAFGYAHVDYCKDTNKYWLGICILPNYQNQGYGKLLMNYIFQQSDVKKIKQIYLTVDVINQNAIKLYKKNKFIQVDFNDKFITMLLSQ
jgi:perosamine synthetase